MIRKAKAEELDRILEIYEAGKNHMRAEGNMNQWINGYPSPEIIAQDIRQDHLYVMEEENRVFAVFAFIEGRDPTYGYIENGAWLRDAPYGTIHRICSDGSRKGVLRTCVAYCEKTGLDLRIDTHADNKSMRSAVAANGFVHCGTIYLENGDPREAFQRLAVSV